MCSRCKNLLTILKSKNGHDGMAISPNCGTWKCSDCGRDLRTKWLDRAAPVLMAIGLWQMTMCDHKQFVALSHRIRKQGSVYFRIRFGTLSVVFHQPLLANRKHKPDESKWMNSAAALAEFKAVLMSDGVTRASCSKALQKPVPKQPSRWRREGMRRKSIGEVNYLFQRLAIDVRIAPAKRFDGRLVDVILLRDFPQMNDLHKSYSDHGTEGSIREMQTIHQLEVVNTPVIQSAIASVSDDQAASSACYS